MGRSTTRRKPTQAAKVKANIVKKDLQRKRQSHDKKISTPDLAVDQPPQHPPSKLHETFAPIWGGDLPEALQKILPDDPDFDDEGNTSTDDDDSENESPPHDDDDDAPKITPAEGALPELEDSDVDVSIMEDDEGSDAFESVDGEDDDDVELEGGLPHGDELIEPQVSDFLDRLETLPAEADRWAFIKELLALLKSAMRANLTETGVGAGIYSKTKKGTAAAENAQLDAKAALIRSLKQDATFRFSPEFTAYDMVLQRGLVVLECLLKDCGPTPKKIKSSTSPFDLFWKDLAVFFRNNSIRNLYCKLIVNSLGPLMMRTLVATPKAAAHVCKGFVIVALYEDPAMIMSYFNVFIDDSAPKPSKKLRECVAESVKTLFHSAARVGILKRPRTETINRLRLWSELTAVILHRLQVAGYEREVYERAFSVVQQMVLSIGNMLHKESRMTEAKKKANLVTLTSVRQWVCSWYLLLACHSLIGAIMLEGDTKTSGFYALRKLSEGICVVLLTLIKRFSAQAEFRPTILHYFNLCIALMQATGSFVSLGMAVIQFTITLASQSSSKKFRKAAAEITSITKPIQLTNLLELDDTQIANPQIVDQVFDETVHIMHDYLALLARHPSFPEVASVLNSQIRKLAKSISTPGVIEKLKTLANSADNSSKQIIVARGSLDPKAVPQSVFVFDEKTGSSFDIVKLSRKRSVRPYFWNEVEVKQSELEEDDGTKTRRKPSEESGKRKHAGMATAAGAKRPRRQ